METRSDRNCNRDHTRAADCRAPNAAALDRGCVFSISVLACFPYAKAYVMSGNPVYPFGNDYFKSPYIDEDLRDHRYEEN